ncbi:MAG: aldose epimerase family protein [Lachnospiraceae bacterium]|nr:aldose epimerase family protein [Lachnospiraceae bacterium]
MGVKVELFGKGKEKKNIFLYTIENANGMRASVTNMGAILVNLFVKNDKGEFKDVVLGLAKGQDYYKNGSFFGATVGRNANRIGGAACKIDGVIYNFPVNDGPNNLHTDFEVGMHMKIWDAEIIGNSVKFTVTSPDMESGFPGNLKMAVTYTLTDDNAIEISYEGVSDKKTVINMTNHSYFNLCGHDSGCIEDTELQLNASYYTPVVKGAIPTGELAAVEGTVFDFRQPKKIGEEIKAKEKQLKLVKGYDHNFAIDNYDGTEKLVATAKAGGITMEVYSDLPGIQFYAGNCIAKQKGKDGVKYGKRTGFCLETQYFPDNVNQENFKKAIFDAGEVYKTKTVYKFV